MAGHLGSFQELLSRHAHQSKQPRMPSEDDAPTFMFLDDAKAYCEVTAALMFS